MSVYNMLLNEHITTGFKDFASKIGVSTSMITEISKGRSNVGVTALQNTVDLFNVDANWLLTGTGEMTKKSEEETSDNLNNNEMEETYKVALKVMAKELKELEKENAELRGRLELNERAIG